MFQSLQKNFAVSTIKIFAHTDHILKMHYLLFGDIVAGRGFGEEGHYGIAKSAIFGHPQQHPVLSTFLWVPQQWLLGLHRW